MSKPIQSLFSTHDDALTSKKKSDVILSNEEITIEFKSRIVHAAMDVHKHEREKKNPRNQPYNGKIHSDILCRHDCGV